MATIREVAKLAGVSVATVSRVMNKNGYINEKTKEKVEAAIKELDYRPNDVARTLFKGTSKMIALFVPDIMNPFFPELARAVEDTANKSGYTFILCNTDNNREKEMKYLYALLQKTIGGVVMVSSSIPLETLNKVNVPIVALDREIVDMISVTVNNRTGAIEAVRHLQESGCKRIAHISGPEDTTSAVERKKGYLEAVEQENWFSEDFITSGEYTFEGAYQAVKELIKKHPEIDGIFAANDLMGVGVLKAAEALNLRVPEDLSVIGFDGIELGKITTPALTTMGQPIYEIGQRAAEIIIDRMENKQKEVTSEQYTVQLIKRQSTK
ncbi:LacI family DNA-binding transcriptional regulator [Oceanobacillus sp. FSL W8-0428]|uniref:LacI family transcriptional regulator n=1 Tax=Oceanobacillus sojae TaxID=582851 RepID=A0A511ZL24_9BACI|nr:LacI family DNA-binding transcriptional regulator [Oceanobacillus sojae]GEN88151.1 LacI family transcriptional regulator [Oceanobacillus sojae]